MAPGCVAATRPASQRRAGHSPTATTRTRRAQRWCLSCYEAGCLGARGSGLRHRPTGRCHVPATRQTWSRRDGRGPDGGRTGVHRRPPDVHRATASGTTARENDRDLRSPDPGDSSSSPARRPEGSPWFPPQPPARSYVSAAELPATPNRQGVCGERPTGADRRKWWRGVDR